MSDPGFGLRLHEAVASRGPLCVGIDPHPHLLDEWQLADTAPGLREFGLRVIDAAAGRVAIVKPQVAFFERHGSEGYAALESVMAAARSAGILVIADAKRADLGSTMDVYAKAWLSPGARLEADAMTVNAYHGVGSLAGTVALARASGKGFFVLAATSNPEAAALQTAVQSHSDGSRTTVAAGIVNDVIALNAAEATPFGSFGVVVGATVSMNDYGISREALSAVPSTPILAPGFGAQGAKFSQIPDRYGAETCVIISASRSILSAGPHGIGAAMDRATGEIAECLA
jgi:orotidine-5'-phosphate decarboxylase